MEVKRREGVKAKAASGPVFVASSDRPSIEADHAGSEPIPPEKVDAELQIAILWINPPLSPRQKPMSRLLVECPCHNHSQMCMAWE